jgi:hypothetical protein
MQIEDKRKAKAKLQATCNSCAERIVVFVFANYLDDVLVWNYAMSGFKRGMEMAGTGFVPACIHVLNSLNLGGRLKIAKQASCSDEKVSASWTQKSRSKDQECVTVSSICKKNAIRQCKHGCIKEEKKRKKEKREK